MFLRAGAARTGGVTLAGLFDAGWTISMVYVMLLLSSFSTYFLPTLAAAEDRNRVITDVLRVTLLIAVPMVSGMIALRPFVLVLLYSPQFLPVTRMMNWMLIGDALKVISFVLAMPMLALADTKAYLTGEVLWNSLMIIGATLAYSADGSLERIGLVFAVSYCVYLMYSLRYCRVRLGWKLPGTLAIPVIIAAVTVLLVSYSAWDCGEIHLTPVSIALAGSSAVALLIVRRRESVSSTVPFLPEANG
jgi:PST family polysaccharide transporter